MDKLKTLFATGHRPARGQHDIAHPVRISIREHCLNQLRRAYLAGNFNTFITGLAQGFDTDFALCVIQLRLEMKGGIYLVGAIPFKEQADHWAKSAKKIYNEIKDQCDNVVEVSPPGIDIEKYMIRNRFMVDQADEGICLWNGLLHGGTRRTIQYALSQGKRVTNLLDVDVAKAI